MIIDLVLLFVGLFFLFVGSEWLISGAASIALHHRIRPVIIGLTIVAFGTSTPEFLVSLFASHSGENGISIGNILGSNVINIALVLGVSLLIKPLSIVNGGISREVIFMGLASGLFWYLCSDGMLGFYDGALLVAILVGFLVYGVITSRDEDFSEELSDKQLGSMTKSIVFIVISVIFLCAGAHMVVDGAVSIAEWFGVSKTFIGISIVAFGTSLPELATTVIAARKEESDLALGNVVGSNIFNICMVMGLVGLISPMVVETNLNWFEFPFMMFISLVLVGLLLKADRLNRRHGIFLIGCFVVYLAGSFISVS
ncbi:calcium/sodium antiporter [Desulfatiferula olefinivorans]